MFPGKTWRHIEYYHVTQTLGIVGKVVKHPLHSASVRRWHWRLFLQMNALHIRSLSNSSLSRFLETSLTGRVVSFFCCKHCSVSLSAEDGMPGVTILHPVKVLNSIAVSCLESITVWLLSKLKCVPFGSSWKIPASSWTIPSAECDIVGCEINKYVEIKLKTDGLLRQVTYCNQHEHSSTQQQDNCREVNEHFG